VTGTTGVADQPGDTPLHYTVTGSGPPLLLIAGTGYPGATWPPDVVTAWSPRFSVITYDHRGTGASPGTDDAYTTRLFADDAARVLVAAGLGPASVLGHSMGGRVAQWLAHDYPDLVARLVLAASGAGGSGSAGQAPDGVPIRTVLLLEEMGYEGFIRDLQRRTFFTAEFAADHPERVRWLGDAFWNRRPSLEDYLKHVVARQRHDATGILESITQPTLVVVGCADTQQGDTGSHVEQSRYLAERIPGAQLVTVPGATHGLLWETPGPTADAIGNWLIDDGEASRR
jgi:pimeloyl-ACP methyl ester carboxylesterase